MKILTQIQKQRNIRNSRFAQARQARSKFNLREKNRNKSIPNYSQLKFNISPLKYKRKKPIPIDLPEFMSLSHNYEETIEFINYFRELILKKRNRVLLNFKTLKHLSSCAAVLFVSELDRWNELYKTKPIVIEIDKWDPIVRKYLFQLGFFKILNVTNPPSEEEMLLTTDKGSNIKDTVDYLEFQTNNMVLGTDAIMLREQLEQLSGEKVAEKKQMFRAITEAMTNVSKHAYPENLKYNPTILYKRWWMSGSLNKKEKTMSVIFFDQGVGIPNTLPNKYPKEIIYGFLKGLGLNVNNDGALIRAAMELARSQTKLPYRGKGLPDVKKYIEIQNVGSLRIISGKGEYKYEAGKEPKVFEHKSSIGGTLIQWDVQL